MSSLVVGGGVAIAIAVVLGALAMVSRAARKGAEAARAQYPNARHIEAAALFFGQESRGAAQMRGTGTLVFTESEIVFEQWVVSREFRIPYRAIQSIENPRWFLGKSQGVKLLKVSYLRDDGAADAIAWRVRELAQSMRAIEAGRAASTPGT